MGVPDFVETTSNGPLNRPTVDLMKLSSDPLSVGGLPAGLFAPSVMPMQNVAP
jgi:hypothetical protein